MEHSGREVTLYLSAEYGSFISMLAPGWSVKMTGADIDMNPEWKDKVWKISHGPSMMCGEQVVWLGVVVDTAKTQVEFVKAIPKNVAEQMTPTQIRAIAGTLKDRDADRDEAVTNSDERNSIQKFVDETY